MLAGVTDKEKIIPTRLVVYLHLSWLAFLLFSGGIFAAETCKGKPATKPITVMFFQPDETRSEFWHASHRFAQAVAQDLNIRLDTILIGNSEKDRFSLKALTIRTLNQHPPPDFILSVLYGGGEFVQLEAFNNRQIPFFTFNSSLSDRVLEITGRPRQQFKYWKGHISPDEMTAGANLVSDLAALKGGKHLAIIGGATASVVNNHRMEGAETSAHKVGISVIPPIHTDWTVENSIQAAKTLLRRVPEVDMFWTAGPEIAEGVSMVLPDHRKDIVIGSFDWAKSNVELVKNGTLALSYGGHFMEAGWALIMIYDYIHGSDFLNDTGNLIHSKLKKLTQSNVDTVEALIAESKWDKIDFTTYSKCLNPSRTTYDFTLPSE